MDDNIISISKYKGSGAKTASQFMMAGQAAQKAKNYDEAISLIDNAIGIFRKDFKLSHLPLSQALTIKADIYFYRAGNSSDKSVTVELDHACALDN